MKNVVCSVVYSIECWETDNGYDDRFDVEVCSTFEKAVNVVNALTGVRHDFGEGARNASYVKSVDVDIDDNHWIRYVIHRVEVL